MNKKQLIVVWAALSLLIGCTTTGRRSSFTIAQQETIKNIINEARDVWSYSTKEFDLYGDGKKEAIVLYAHGTHHSGVKVIKFDGDKADIIFDENCSTSNIDFKVIMGIPTIILEDSNYDPDYATSKRHKRTYKWDGKNFINK